MLNDTGTFLHHPLLLKGLEEEIYTGLVNGQIVGMQQRIDKALSGFNVEPDLRNPEYFIPPFSRYEEIATNLLDMRSKLRRWLKSQGKYTLIPGASLSLGESSVFLISDDANKYYQFIRDTYGTRVVTTGTHINIGLDDSKALFRAARLLRAEACLFLAITAASPFLDGTLTGYHSTRWSIFPGTPDLVPLFESKEEYKVFVQNALAKGNMYNNRHLWVSVRPNGPDVPKHLNRVELRICDLIYDPRIILGITALAEARIQAMLADPSLDPLVESKLPFSTRSNDLLEIIMNNEEAVAKYSLDATVRHWRDGRELPIRKWLKEYISDAHKKARFLGIDHYLQPLWDVLKQGNTAMQWTKQYNRGLSIEMILKQSILAMEEAEKLYAQRVPLRKY
jgi:predicted glutamate--cysteine ligase